VPLWRNRDFTLLWTSQVASTVGTRLTAVAYPLLVLLLTGSPALAGVVAFAQTLPFLLLYLPGGAWTDRWDRRRTMVACDLGRAVALGSVAVVALVGGVDAVTVSQLAAVAFAEGCLFVLFDLAEGAALPHIVPAEQVPAAVAYNQARVQGADLVGQPLGGILFALSPAVPFAVDAATYLVSGGAVAAIRSRLQGERAPVATRLRAQILEGLRFVRGSAFLRDTVVLVAGMNLVFNGLFLALVVRARDLGASPARVGLMLGVFGVGGVLGSIAAPWLHRRLPGRLILVGTAWAWAGLMALQPLAPSPLWLGVVAGVIALFGPVFNVVVGAYFYRVTPDELMGRVRSTIRLVAWGSIPVGSLLGGVLAEALGGGTALLVLGLGMLPVAVGTTLSRGMHEISAADPDRSQDQDQDQDQD
jgi:MFS family permease